MPNNMMDMPDLVTGPDGRPRCRWAASAPEYLDYHDHEWGRPVHDEVALFERLCLEGFQTGLSWLLILRKRAAFRRAFAGFEPAVVARFGAADVRRLVGDPRLVRNRRKVEATIANARAVLALDGTTLAALVWSYAPAARPAPATLQQVPSRTPESAALARDLRRRGFRQVGPTTVYALMQACGIVDDHLPGCCARRSP